MVIYLVLSQGLASATCFALRPTWQARRVSQYFQAMPPQGLVDWQETTGEATGGTGGSSILSGNHAKSEGKSSFLMGNSIIN